MARRIAPPAAPDRHRDRGALGAGGLQGLGEAGRRESDSWLRAAAQPAATSAAGAPAWRARRTFRGPARSGRHGTAEAPASWGRTSYSLGHLRASRRSGAQAPGPRSGPRRERDPKRQPLAVRPTSSPGQRQRLAEAAGRDQVPTPRPPRRRVTGQQLTGKVIVLDPGHNLNNSSSINTIVYAGNGVYKACDTTGTSTNAGYPEHAFTWDVANRAAAILRAEGATVILTRPNDTSIGPCITTRAQIGNDAHANAFVAIHADGGPAGGHGFFVMQPPPNNPNVNPGGAPQSRILATVMHDTFHAVTGIPVLDVHRERLLPRHDNYRHDQPLAWPGHHHRMSQHAK